jgi:hypothetical protein
LNVQGESNLKPQTIRHLLNHSESNNSFRKHGKPTHDFSLILSKHDDLVVVACSDYPRCNDTITVFGLRD